MQLLGNYTKEKSKEKERNTSDQDRKITVKVYTDYSANSSDERVPYQLYELSSVKSAGFKL